MRPIRVAIADADADMRASLRSTLDADARFVICAEAADAPAAIRAAVRKRPHVYLLGLDLHRGGLAACREILACLPAAKVVVLSAAPERAELIRALRAGASGYLPRSVELRRLPHVLLDVFNGEAALPRALVASVLEDFRDPVRLRRRVAYDGVEESLTSREWQVLDLMRRDHSTAEIARELYLSQATIRSHVSRILKKLGAPDRAAAVELLPRR